MPSSSPSNRPLAWGWAWPPGADAALLAQARQVSETEQAEHDLVAQVRALTSEHSAASQHASTNQLSTTASTPARPSAAATMDIEEDLLQAALRASKAQAEASEKQLLHQALLESRQGMMPTVSLRSAVDFEVVASSLPAADPVSETDEEEEAMLAAALAASVQDADQADAAFLAFSKPGGSA